MHHTAPVQLLELLRAPEAALRDSAWEQLIGSHTRLLLAVARSFGGGHDSTMDRYAHVLEKLRESDFRRLRTFQQGRGASFSTWLTVTARRLCLDHHRALYGRSARDGAPVAGEPRGVRRALVDHLAARSSPTGWSTRMR